MRARRCVRAHTHRLHVWQVMRCMEHGSCLFEHYLYLLRTLIFVFERKRVRDAAFFLIIMLVTFAATLLNPQKYVSSRTIQKCVEHVSTST